MNHLIKQKQQKIHLYIHQTSVGTYYLLCGVLSTGKKRGNQRDKLIVFMELTF